MLLATLTLMAAVTDCGISSDAASYKRQYDCVARELAARRPFVARLTPSHRDYPGLVPVAYHGDASGTVQILSRDDRGRVHCAVIYSPTSTAPLRVGWNVTAPVLANEVRKRVRNPHDIQGLVIVETTIGRDGRVTKTQILKALPYGLDKVAAEAVKTLRFQPGTFFGQPVPVMWNVSVHFRDDELIIPAMPVRHRGR